MFGDLGHLATFQTGQQSCTYMSGRLLLGLPVSGRSLSGGTSACGGYDGGIPLLDLLPFGGSGVGGGDTLGHDWIYEMLVEKPKGGKMLEEGSMELKNEQGIRRLLLYAVEGRRNTLGA